MEARMGFMDKCRNYKWIAFVWRIRSAVVSCCQEHGRDKADAFDRLLLREADEMQQILERLFGIS